MIYIEDYKGYKEANKELIEKLKERNSIIFDHFNDVLTVLGYIEMMKDTNNLDEDLEIIFDSGFAYFFSQFEMVKLMYDKYFNKKFSEFVEYEVLVNYYLYLEDLKDTLKEENRLNRKLKEGLENILFKIENIISSKTPYEDSMLEDLNNDVENLSISNPPLTTQEVFGMIIEELGL